MSLPLGLEARRELKAQTEFREQLAHKVFKGCREQLEYKVLTVFKVQLACKVFRAFKV
jgi:hypothetical protein